MTKKNTYSVFNTDKFYNFKAVNSNQKSIIDSLGDKHKTTRKLFI